MDLGMVLGLDDVMALGAPALERCTRQPVLIAARSAKCLSSLLRAGTSIARNATGREELISSDF